ncbi:MAG: hypothetical protein PARBA_01294 [Parabacteroides sp.]
MKKFYFLLLLLFTVGFTNCTKEDAPDVPPIDPNEARPHAKTNRTVLAYLVGDMNLWYALEETVNKMEEGWDDDIDGTLLVYLDNSNHLTQFGQPVLLEITHDTTDMIVSKVVKTYEDQDAGNPNVIQTVLSDVVTLYPAESQGLIIGAHGNGWLPGIEAHSETKGLSGPDRYGSTLEIADLAKVLPVKYDFIIFHACNMSNAESVYQLRNKCDYIMASALPLPGYGYPYETIIPYLYTKPHADLYKAAKLSATDYSTNKDKNTFDGFTVAITKTSELENLATATSKLLESINMSYDEMRHTLNENKNLVDYYESILLDISGLYFLSENEDLKNTFKNAIDKAIIQFYFVPGDISEQEELIRIADYGSGLSFYLPILRNTPGLNQINTAFKNNYDWSKATGFDKDRK